MNDDLRRAREAYDRRDWPHARELFLAARANEPLAAEDLYRLADSVWWLGAFREAHTLHEEAYHLYVREQQPGKAAMSAMAAAGLSFMRGEHAAGSGWMSRALRLLEGLPPGVEHGYLLFVQTTGALQSGDTADTITLARQLQAAGQTYGDPNLVALGTVYEGQALIRQGAFERGLRLLDEAMLAAASGSLAPAWAGNIYCMLMVACHELGDLSRAREWTQATSAWCESLPAAGPFFGVCRVHRAQIFLLQGDWDRAEADASRTCQDLAEFDLATVAEGYYQIGEARRLRGDLAGAEAAYRDSHRFGRDPQPGLALLSLARSGSQR